MTAHRTRRQLEILVTKGVVPLDECRRAERLARSAGITFDTAILEIGVLDEDLLTRILAEGFGVTPAYGPELATPDPDALARVPRKLVKSGGLVPFRLSGTRLSVAMRDFDDYGLLDELAFVTSRRIEPCFAVEPRLEWAIAKIAGDRPPPRLTSLLERLDAKRARSVAASDQELLAPIDFEAPAAPSAPPSLPLPDAAPDPPEPALSAPELESAASSTPAKEAPGGVVGGPVGGPAPAHTSPPASPLDDTQPVVPSSSPAVASLEALGARLAEVRERDQVAELLLRYLAPSFRRVILLMLRGKEVAGWYGRGENVDATRLAELRIPLSEPSLFLNLREGTASYSGPLPNLPTHQRFADVWGGALPERCALHQISIRGRLVAALYVDGERREGASGELAEIASKAGIAFEICILRLKLQGP